MLSNKLNLLFEMELQYQEGMAAMTSAEGKIGQYIGSGDGTASGEEIQGNVRWDLYEVIDEARCQTNFAGVIETDDGAQVHFDARGYGMATNPSQPDAWHMVYAVQFETADEKYYWLNTTLALWDGQLDMKNYRHHYRVYAQN